MVAYEGFIFAKLYVATLRQRFKQDCRLNQRQQLFTHWTYRSVKVARSPLRMMNKRI